jgi:hypothetical protein
MNDLTGKQFGRLTVVGYSSSDSSSTRRGRLWNCRCVCGTECIKSTSKLNEGVKSCGCLLVESARKSQLLAVAKTTKLHSPYRRKLKDVYQNMIKRCYDPKNKRYDRYGGRGVRVCQEWIEDRYVFFKWCLDNGYDHGLQVDRIDNNGDYHPFNCRLVSAMVQQNNTSRNRSFTWLGLTLTVAQWERRLGWKRGVMQHRLDRGWDVERMMSQPPRAGRQ